MGRANVKPGGDDPAARFSELQVEVYDALQLLLYTALKTGKRTMIRVSSSTQCPPAEKNGALEMWITSQHRGKDDVGSWVATSPTRTEGAAVVAWRRNSGTGALAKPWAMGPET